MDTKLVQWKGETIVGNECTIFCNYQKLNLTVPLLKLYNVTIFYLATGYDKLTAFCTESGMDVIDECNHIFCISIISYYKGYLNEFYNIHIHNYDYHHANYLPD